MFFAWQAFFVSSMFAFIVFISMFFSILILDCVSFFLGWDFVPAVTFLYLRVGCFNSMAPVTYVCRCRVCKWGNTGFAPERLLYSWRTKRTVRVLPFSFKRLFAGGNLLLITKSQFWVRNPSEGNTIDIGMHRRLQYTTSIFRGPLSLFVQKGCVYIRRKVRHIEMNKKLCKQTRNEFAQAHFVCRFYFSLNVHVTIRLCLVGPDEICLLNQLASGFTPTMTSSSPVERALFCQSSRVALYPSGHEWSRDSSPPSQLKKLPRRKSS